MNHDASPDDLLDELAGLRARARRDRRATSTPLLVLGTVTLVAAFLPAGAVRLPGSYFWMLAGPLVFGVVAGVFRHREHRSGVGSPTRHYRITAILLLAVFLVLFPLVATFGAAMGAVGLGLLVLAAAQRDLVLATIAVVYGAVGVLQSLYIVSNAVWHVSGATVSDGAVIVVLGTTIMAVGGAARVRESTTA